jgi:hypothetical protein
MNSASLLLRLLAIAGAIAAGVFFYMNNGKLDKLTADLAAKAQSAEADKQNGDKTLADAQTQLVAAAQSIKDMNDKLRKATDDASLADQRFSGVNDQLDTLSKQATDKNRQISDLNAKVTDLQGQADGIPDLQKQVSDAQAQHTADLAAIAAIQAAPPKPAATGDNTSTATNGVTNTDMAVVVPKNLSKAAPAKILLVDTKNWLMALNVGSDAGVQKDAELYLTVGDQNLAVVKVLDTTATQSSAAIMSTEDIAPNKFSSIATKGLNVAYQTEVSQ